MSCHPKHAMSWHAHPRMQRHVKPPHACNVMPCHPTPLNATLRYDIVCSGNIVACMVTSLNCGPGGSWFKSRMGVNILRGSIDCTWLPEPSSFRGSASIPEQPNIKIATARGTRIDWWCGSFELCSATHACSGIIWQMPQKWSQFNCMTLSWWPCHSISYITLPHIA